MNDWPPPALVLCAGLGTRLRPLSAYLAKPAMPVGDDTLVGRILRQLADAGIADAVLNLHHLPHTVTRAVGDGSQYGLRVRYSWEQPQVLGSAGGPRHALPLVEGDTILVVNGDTLCDLPLRQLWEHHRHAGALVTLGLMPHPEPGCYGGVTLDVDLPASAGMRGQRPDLGERADGGIPGAEPPDPVPGSPFPVPGSVTGFVPRTSRVPSVHYPGIQLVERRVLETLPDGTPAESVAELYPRLIREQPGSVRGVVFDAHFDDVGTIDDYRRTCRALAGDAAGNVIDPRATVAPTASLHHCVVWPGASVPDHCHLDTVVVTGRVPLLAGTKLVNSVA